MTRVAVFVAILLATSSPVRAFDDPAALAGAIAARSFVDTSQIVSKYTTEQYAHQCTLRIIEGTGYVAYQCNETSTDENVAGQIARLAVFNLLEPTSTAEWIDVARAGDASNNVSIGGTFVASPILHTIDQHTLRIFFNGRSDGDPVPTYRVFYRDLDLATRKLSDVKQAHCTTARETGKTMELALPAVQRHLDHLFGAGFGARFPRGISTACDMVRIGDQLYSTVQIKNSEEGRTLLMTNVLMRSRDDGATWELLGAPDPRQLPGESADAVKILAEPALTHDARNIYLHLRSNVVENGYVLSKASKQDLYAFDAPEKKWTYGIGRPTIGDFGQPIGLVAMFTARSVPLGGAVVTRNKCDVVRIDANYRDYRLAFSIVDYNAVNTPFMQLYRDEMYVAYTTGRRRLTPKFGTSEIVFTKLRREFFVPIE